MTFTPGPWTLAYEGFDDEDNDLSEVRAACHEHPSRCPWCIG